MVTIETSQEVDCAEININQIEDKIRLFLSKTFSKQDVLIELIFTTPIKVKQLNQKYRHKPNTTDVLSFPIWPDKQDILSNKNVIVNLGTIVINLNQVKKQAVISKRSTTEECIFLALHSLDHLLGKHHAE